MDEDEYYPQQQYEDMPQQEEQDIQTKVQLDFFEAQGFIRNNQLNPAVQALQKLYKLCEENNLRTWKTKILNYLLQLYCKKGLCAQVNKTLNQILQLNEKEKLSDTSIKSIIGTLKTLQSQQYKELSPSILSFLGKLQTSSTLKGYLFMLERSITEGDKIQAEKLLLKAEESAAKVLSIPPEELLVFYSLQIKFSKITGIDITSKLKRMEFKLSTLQNQAYMNDTNLSIIKESLAQIHYQLHNFKASAKYLNESFQEYVRFGKNSQIKNLLKINVLVTILTEDPQIVMNQKFNLVYHDSSSAFKVDSDVFCLYGIIQSFQEKNETKFTKNFKELNLQVGKNSVYGDLFKRLIKKLRKRKVQDMLGSYKRIKFSYLENRIGETRKQLENIIFELIVDKKVNGVINHEKGYVEMLPPENSYLKTQLANIQNISVKF